MDVVSVEKPTNKELLSRCLRLLARRDLPRAEFVNKLRTAGFDRDEIEGAADWAEAEGFLDENRYAEVAARRLSGKYSASRVVHTLRDRGVTEAAIADVAPGLKLSELDQARAIWIRRFHEPASNPNDKSRQIRFLQARGFSFDIIKQVIKGPEN